MSRYICHKCGNEHGTDNMVAFCASCFSDAHQAGRREAFEEAAEIAWNRMDGQDVYDQLMKKAKAEGEKG